MSDCDIKLFDRVKQKSTHAAGTGTIELNSSVAGFKDFTDVYGHSGVFFYCINDGTNFEIGSGVLLRADYDAGDSITVNQVERNVMYSSASDNSLINFATTATKEIFVTYPATHSVSIGSGIAGVTLPQKSGVAFWNCNNIIDYDNNFVWNKDSKRLGIRNSNPSYGIDIGGDGSDQSMIRASGYHVGATGIHFPSGNGSDASYVGGIQYQHFLKNQLLNANTENVFALSGVVNETIYIKKQPAGTFLAGPASGCSPPCSPDYPNFRPITLSDIPLFEEFSGVLQSQITSNLSDIGNASGAFIPLRVDQTAVSGIAQDALDASGFLRTDLTAISGIAQDALDASGALQSDLTSVSGIAQDIFDASGQFLTGSGVANYSAKWSGLKTLTSGIIFDNGSRVGINTESPTSALDINSSGIRIRTSGTPTSSSPGEVGEITWDLNYIYVCVSGNVWKRSGLSEY